MWGIWLTVVYVRFHVRYMIGCRVCEVSCEGYDWLLCMWGCMWGIWLVVVYVRLHVRYMIGCRFGVLSGASSTKPLDIIMASSGSTSKLHTDCQDRTSTQTRSCAHTLLTHYIYSELLAFIKYSSRWRWRGDTSSAREEHSVKIKNRQAREIAANTSKRIAAYSTGLYFHFLKHNEIFNILTICPYGKDLRRNWPSNQSN